MSQRDGKEALQRAPFGIVVRDGDALHTLTQRGAYLLLAEDGLHIGEKRFSQKSRFIRYEDITHIVPAKRSIWLGTRRSLAMIARGRRTKLDAAAVTSEIEARIVRRPGGAEQLALMRANDRRLRSGYRRRVTGAFVLLWVAVHALQFQDAYLTDAGSFAGELVAQGEWWRVLTSQFLHQLGLPEPMAADSSVGRVALGLAWLTLGSLAPLMPLHIAMNSLLALFFGSLVERFFGARRTLVIFGVAGVGAALASAVAGERMIGGSGFVLGLAGAALALELTAPERLPAPWRLPRALFVLVLVAEALVGFSASFIAGAAHLGGFAGGYLAARALSRGAIHSQPASMALRTAAAGVVVALVASVAAMAPLVLRLPYAMNEHADHVLNLPKVGAGVLNDLAWRIATESAAMPDRGDRALALAERAVEETGRNNPDFLDTLAEVQFLSGDPDSAVLTIEEAIDIAPWDDYFREQRDRFIGLRGREDRPVPPRGRWDERGPTEFAPWDAGDGVAI